MSVDDTILMLTNQHILLRVALYDATGVERDLVRLQLEETAKRIAYLTERAAAVVEARERFNGP